MPLLTITNLLTSPVAIQDPTGLYGTSILVPGSGTYGPTAISLPALGAIEAQLVAETTGNVITWTVADDPASAADTLPEHEVTVLVSPYNAVAGDQDILTNLTTPGAVSVVLSASAKIGQYVKVVDLKGDAAANNITITVAGGGTINGGASAAINVNNGWAYLLKVSATAWVSVAAAVVSTAAAGGDLTGNYPNPTLAAIFFGAPQALSGAGAVNVTTRTTNYTSTGAGQALTLANGTKTGQRKSVHHTVDGGSGTLTPTTAGNFATVQFVALHDWAELEWTGAAWNLVAFGGSGIVVT